MRQEKGDAVELSTIFMDNAGNEEANLLAENNNGPSDAAPLSSRSGSGEAQELVAEDFAPRPAVTSNGFISGRGNSGDLESKGSGVLEKGSDERMQFLQNLTRPSLNLGNQPHQSGKERLKQLTPVKRYYAVAIFTLTAALLYSDQNLMAPLLTPIAAEFGFNDEQKDRYLGGYIAALFFAFGAPSALLCGYLCDRVDRRLMLFIVVLLGEGPCLATYFVSHYWQLLVLRVLTGISVGGTLPLVFSLVGDLFDLHHRATVAASIQLATGAGLAAGQAISGFIGPLTGWRWPFVIVAVPAILVATLMIFTTSEPPRGAQESTLQERYEQTDEFSYNEQLDWRKLRIVLTTMSNYCVVLQGLPGSLPWGVLLTFLNDFLYRDQHLSLAAATGVILWWGIGGGVGVLGGGIIGQALYNRKPLFMPLFVGLCISSAALPIWFLINAELKHISLFWPFAAAFLGGMLSSPPGPNARAVILNVNEPESRGIVLGMQTVLDDIGKGAGPFIVSLLVGAFRRRRPAFNIAVGAWIPCGLIFACASFSLSKDESAMQERLKAKVMLQPVSTSESASADVDELYSAPRIDSGTSAHSQH